METLKVLILGDANVDVTLPFGKIKPKINSLSIESQKLLQTGIDSAKKDACDFELYLDSPSRELSELFDSLDPKVAFGGCGAIKALTLASMGHEVEFHSRVGNDHLGKMIISELKSEGVNCTYLRKEGKTNKTLNLFVPDSPRVAFSYWDIPTKEDILKFKKRIKEYSCDLTLLAGAHRKKTNIGYASLAKVATNPMVCMGSFAAYLKEELDMKKSGDFSVGGLIGNDSEVCQLAEIKPAQKAISHLTNELVIMHGSPLSAVKVGKKVITHKHRPIEKERIVELTGIGDVWEATFLASCSNPSSASENEIKDAMDIAAEAAVFRLLTGGVPLL